MTSATAFITKRRAPAYFLLTFVISWGSVLLVIGGPAGIHGARAETDPLFPLVFLAMLAGPSVAGLLMTGLVRGRAGLRDLCSRLVRWRVGGRWYASALLIAPILAVVVLLGLSRASHECLPGIVATTDRPRLLLFALAVGLAAGFFEELGWTGFAIPALRERHGILATGLIVGLLWGAWHVLVVVWGIGNRAGPLSLPFFVLLDTLSFLPAFRVLMVWVYDRTGSLLVSMLMHASLTASALIFTPPVTGSALLTYDVALAAVLWAIIAALAAAHRGQLARHSRWRPLA